MQIADQFRVFGAGMTLKVQVVLGGEDLREQAKELSLRPHIVVATPGRLMEHFMYDQSLPKCFGKLRTLVLDEADRMLDPSFETELQIILHALPVGRWQAFTLA